jgi:hypothetical protein
MKQVVLKELLISTQSISTRYRNGKDFAIYHFTLDTQFGWLIDRPISFECIVIFTQMTLNFEAT